MTTPDPQQQQPPVDGPDPIGSPPPPVPDTDPEHQALLDERDALRTRVKKVEHTRTRATFYGLVIGALITILLLVFILQNLESQRIMLIFWEVNLPLGVSLLIAAIAGALIVAFAGGLRMLQMSRAMRKAKK
ncbi:lipopolysaccharide assembly protein LapA domain-containing protein [Gordonia sp. LSe1-13]|uniref:Lipopolysaccharide assembly protein LapA domain-containing protein n=1 Tax=Gordonia sesuvii TaxID=3116777 RepID=A0ABU7MC41_9ACTN|nr:lipopolysaccharide assembly protein LapA domain-containing protein [Gordonia sp. LSe1-13]